MIEDSGSAQSGQMRDATAGSGGDGPWRSGLVGYVLGKSGTGFLYQAPDLSCLLSGNLPPDLAVPVAAGQSDIEIFGAREGERLAIIKRQVLDNRQSQTIEIERSARERVSTYRIEVEHAEIDGMFGVLSIVTDVSETRHRERILKTLLREVSHRSKNLLAIIQGIATQTARQARSLDSFLIAFRGRIQSLSSSQDLVTDSSWRGAYLFDLAARQIGAYWPSAAAPLSMTGLNAHLSPNAALHVGLALHELVVNSASFGALAAGADSLTLDCSDTVFENGPAIEIAWIEHIAPRREPSGEAEQTFARTVLERVVPAAVAGRALYIVSPDRVEYHLVVPAREYEIVARNEE